jgi:IS30 family transposase
MSHQQLTITEREVIAEMKFAGHKNCEIAAKLSRSPSTISRELKRNLNSRQKYSASQADRKSKRRRKESKLPWKLHCGPLREFVIDKLRKDWSPEQIAGQLPKLFPSDKKMRVSIESIYVWVRGNKSIGGTLYKHLRRSGKKRRKRYGSGGVRGQIANRKSIDQRPVSANNRSRFGHWESDTVEGKKGTGYLVTHVERKTGFLIASYLPDKKSETLNAESVQAFSTIPSELTRTLTTDNGKEFAGHESLEKSLACSIYFADPYSPWQRGQNENTNGLLRQYFPKGSDFSKLTCEQVRQAVCSLNHRPRKKYQFKTPHELLNPKIIAFQN